MAATKSRLGYTRQNPLKRPALRLLLGNPRQKEAPRNSGCNLGLSNTQRPVVPITNRSMSFWLNRGSDRFRPPFILQAKPLRVKEAPSPTRSEPFSRSLINVLYFNRPQSVGTDANIYQDGKNCPRY